MYLKTYMENVYKARWYFWSWTKEGWICWLGHNIRLVFLFLSFPFFSLTSPPLLLLPILLPLSFLYFVHFVTSFLPKQKKKKKIIPNIWMSKILMGGYVLIFLWLMEMYTSYYCLLIHRVSLGRLVDNQIISSLLVTLNFSNLKKFM